VEFCLAFELQIFTAQEFVDCYRLKYLDKSKTEKANWCRCKELGYNS